jgi:hypothetical protein
MTKVIRMSEDEKQIIKRLMNDCWQYIGSDALQALQECEGETSIPRDEVIELVLDADRIETLILNHHPVDGKDEQEAFAKFKKLDYKRKCEIGRQAFRYERYGW